ncbi:MAG TPA: 50S ribosomal protein L10 [Nannocystaceae bacterium]|nr:50S ribosomal protein L10 [Nannocystaceae bacterium]
MSKQEESQKLREKLTGVAAFVFIDFAGMTVADATELRNKFRDAGCAYNVYKNSTIRFAITETVNEPAKVLLKGMTGLAFSSTDPGAPARVVRDLGKEMKSLRVKGGVIEGTVLDEQGVERLADMPGPRELKAQFLALLNTPATQLVRVLNAVPQSFLYLLNAKKDKDAA